MGKENKLDDYEFLMKINSEQMEEIFLYFSLSEFKYKIYDRENRLLSKSDLLLEFIWVENLKEFIKTETKKFIRNKKLEQLLDGGQL